MTIWLNGRLISAVEARIDPADRGFTLGDGVFETIRIKDGRPRHLSRHLERLAAGVALLRLPLPYDAGELSGAMAVLVAATGTADGVLRLTLSRGTGARGVLPPADARPTLLMTVATATHMTAPVAAVIARCTRRNEHSPLSRLKSLNYLDSILARQEAAERGADEALLLNGAGRLAESSVATLFLSVGGRLLTPPITDGALPGIRRALILERHGAEEAPLAPEDLARADEAILTNSLGLRPLVAVDGRPVGSAGAGPALARLLEDPDL
ncbi:branched-chain amino acid aminotransferase (plasmid) [Azospirillum sp. B510]|uniref:aminotransferase class IV n=1 Tax=Azospirillum sp. (strain B510) TaxID=137722 RepID=UPI0001C4CA6B|nr:aminotransferase class IV [Azospirillum sp. B510]BAI75789.1 branched-chain amino acid aminotransferase [Azospirillum sp. B510]